VNEWDREEIKLGEEIGGRGRGTIENGHFFDVKKEGLINE
jgi:hypothetical protein